MPSLLGLAAGERLDLAGALRTLVRGYDRLFGFSLPYVMSMLQALTDGSGHKGISHLHLEFTPPTAPPTSSSTSPAPSWAPAPSSTTSPRRTPPLASGPPSLRPDDGQAVDEGDPGDV